ncbi:helix-turn-helix domain-containing protein [Occultella gossypii]|uniref:Helix-turn-helix domain-containing protein n=1 Tax=Occultella gossypii TaxID=2800820 RepID=A0ABS7SAR4_9MICO|nr:PucR family transcriptional regulator [Occultella gossypii]MBZ2196376.1 helix-turn-helix domain-containing protein [Occultella gossypii]
MRLRDLLDAEDLDLRLLVGDDSALEAPVNVVYTTDLIDPGRYLSGGELVISGLMWRQGPADSETFVATIRAAGAVALAAGTAYFGPVPQDVVAACARHGLVLFEVPPPVSFATLTEYIVGRVGTERGDQLAARLDRQRRLLLALAQGYNVAELLGQVRAETGLACRVLTPSGRRLAGEGDPLSDATLDHITEAYLRAPRLPTVVTVPTEPGDAVGPWSVFAGAGALADRVTTTMVLVEGNWADWPEDHLDTITQLCAVVALDEARRAPVRQVAHTLADGVLALVAQGHGSGAEAHALLDQCGVDPHEPFVAVVAGPGPGAPAGATGAILDDVAAHLGRGAVGSVGPDGVTLALVPAARVDAAERVRAAALRLTPAMGARRFCVGISARTTDAAIAGALDEARHAFALARLRPAPVEVVTAAEVTSHVGLLAAVPDEVRRAFSARVLGALATRRAEHQDASLEETLVTFLENDGSWTRTAQALHLHVNTVRYRIGRVEELTGRDLSRFADRVDVFLALGLR